MRLSISTRSTPVKARETRRRDAPNTARPTLHPHHDIRLDLPLRPTQHERRVEASAACAKVEIADQPLELEERKQAVSEEGNAPGPHNPRISSIFSRSPSVVAWAGGEEEEADEE